MVGGIGWERGDCSPRIVSSDQGRDQAVTLADCGRIDPPQIALAVTVTGCKQNAIALHVHHNGVNGALVALGIQSHAPHNIRACLIAVLNQVGADGSADDAVKVHRVVW